MEGEITPAEPSRKCTIAFIDGQNLYHSVRKAFGYGYSIQVVPALSGSIFPSKSCGLVQRSGSMKGHSIYFIGLYPLQEKVGMFILDRNKMLKVFDKRFTPLKDFNLDDTSQLQMMHEELYTAKGFLRLVPLPKMKIPSFPCWGAGQKCNSHLVFRTKGPIQWFYVFSG
jgi:hypothetical protein